MCKCIECGKQINNPYYINGKAYGYSCYKKQLALIYKKETRNIRKIVSQLCKYSKTRKVILFTIPFVSNGKSAKS